MICPKCKSTKSKIIDSRPTARDLTIRRRHKCKQCGFRFTTYEMLAWDYEKIAKRLRWME